MLFQLRRFKGEAFKLQTRDPEEFTRECRKILATLGIPFLPGAIEALPEIGSIMAEAYLNRPRMYF